MDVSQSQSIWVDNITDTEVKRRLTEYGLTEKTQLHQQLQILGKPVWNLATLQDVFFAAQAAEAASERTATSPPRKADVRKDHKRFKGPTHRGFDAKAMRGFLASLMNQQRVPRGYQGNRNPRSRQEAEDALRKASETFKAGYNTWRSGVTKEQEEAARNGAIVDGYRDHNACRRCLNAFCRPHLCSSTKN